MHRLLWLCDYVTKFINCSLPNVQTWHQFEFRQKQYMEHQQVFMSGISIAGCTTCLLDKLVNAHMNISNSQGSSVPQIWASV